MMCAFCGDDINDERRSLSPYPASHEVEHVHRQPSAFPYLANLVQQDLFQCDVRFANADRPAPGAQVLDEFDRCRWTTQNVRLGGGTYRGAEGMSPLPGVRLFA